MSHSVRYQASPVVVAVIPTAVIELTVKMTVDYAYDNNFALRDECLMKRYNLFTVSGKVTSGKELVAALHNHPELVSQLLLIVFLTQCNGENHARVLLQSEIPDMAKKAPGLKELIEKPPDITVADMVAEARRHRL